MDTFFDDLEESLVVSSRDNNGDGEMDPEERRQMLQHKDDIHKQSLKHADDRHQQFLKHTDDLHKQDLRHRDEAHKQNMQIAKQQNAGLGHGGAMYTPQPLAAPAPPGPAQLVDTPGGGRGTSGGTGGVSGSAGATGQNA